MILVSCVSSWLSNFYLIIFFCFGFSIIFDRLADNGKSYKEATSLHLSNYAEDGFRTLAFAYRILEAAEYEHWNSLFSQAKTTIGPERDELLDKLSDMIEKDMILLGAAAIEDKLQKGVSHLSLRAFKFLITFMLLGQTIVYV